MSVHDDLALLLNAGRVDPVLRDAVLRVQAEIERLIQERDAALRGNWKQDPTGEGGLGKEEQYWLRNKLRSAVVHLRDIEDYYVMRGGTPESPNLERARRARSLYEQISEDFINGSIPVPTMRDRAEAAEAALAEAERRIAWLEAAQ